MADADTYIRQLTVNDLDECVSVEAAAFPPNEAASREKIEYRLSISPQTCRGLFLRAADGDHLLAHTISTKTDNEKVQDEDMVYPEDWKVNPTGHSVGHRPEGRTIALHSLAVTPSHQKAGLGKGLMKAYIEEMRGTGDVDRIAILTYEKLVPYYVNLGFTNYGKSVSEYAGVAWQALAYEFNSA